MLKTQFLEHLNRDNVVRVDVGQQPGVRMHVDHPIHRLGSDALPPERTQDEDANLVLPRKVDGAGRVGVQETPRSSTTPGTALSRRMLHAAVWSAFGGG
jgi:hypothetical protein